MIQNWFSNIFQKVRLRNYWAEGTELKDIDYFREIVADSLKDKSGKIVGKKNAYPDYIAMITNRSPMASACLGVLKEFCYGNGFSDNIGGTQANEDETLAEILSKVANDIAYLHRFAIAIEKDFINGFFIKTKIYHLPIEWVRLGIPNQEGYVNQVHYNPYYNSTDEFSGRARHQAKCFYTYTDNVSKSSNQLGLHRKNANANEPYTEVLFWSESNEIDRVYSRPSYFESGEDLFRSDAGIWEFYEAEIRNNFFLGGILAMTGNPDEPIPSKEGDIQITRGEALDRTLGASFGGSEKAGSIMTVWSENPESAPNFIPYTSNTNDSKFVNVRDSARTTIPSVMQVSPLLAGIEISGKLGDSKEKEGAIRFQNEKTRWARIQLTKSFKQILQNFPNITNEQLQILEVMPKEEYLSPPDYIWQSLPENAKLEYIKDKFPDLSKYITTQSSNSDTNGTIPNPIN